MSDSVNIFTAQGSGPMAKAMSIAGMVVAGLLLVVFAADLVLHIPFGGVQMMTDIGFVVGGAILAYLSWNAFRDSR